MSDTTVSISDTTNLDAAFKKARELAFNGNYSLSRRYCQKILEKNPNYFDVRTFIGRTYAWEKQYDLARTEFSKVLLEKENDFEALSGMFDVEYWTENLQMANDYLKIALGYYPNSEELLLKKAKLQLQMEEKENAALTLRRILDRNPGNKDAIKLMNSIAGKKLNNTLEFNYLVDLFDKRDKPQQVLSTELGRNFSFGSLTIRMNAADRFGNKGIQPEIESYIHFTKGTYLNMVTGFSNLINLFPKEKYGIELYQRLPAGFEGSLGVRYLKFTRTSTVYTTSLSNYYKDYWFNVRAFITPKTDSTIQSAQLKKSSFTLLVSFRNYFGDSENYFGIRIGQGRSPDENRTLDVANQLLSYQAGIEIQKTAFNTWYIRGNLTYGRENTRVNYYRQRITSGITIKKVF